MITVQVITCDTPRAPSRRASDEQRAEELVAQGKLRLGRPGGLAGRRPLPPHADMPPLSRALDDLRREEDR